MTSGGHKSIRQGAGQVLLQTKGTLNVIMYKEVDPKRSESYWKGWSIWQEVKYKWNNLKAKLSRYANL